MAAIWNAKSALQILQQCQPIIDFKSATDYLWTKLNTYQLLSLYQELFPLEWEKSQSELYSEGENHSPKELEFISLVNEHLFPIDDMIIESAYEERLYQIPVSPKGVDWQDHEEGIDALRSGWQILLPLSQSGRWWLESVAGDEGESWYEGTFGYSFQDIAHPEKANFKLLKKLARRTAPPISALPTALALLDLGTDNIWLDQSVCSETYWSRNFETRPWTIEAINSLASEWNKAIQLLDKAYELINWIESDQNINFSHILALWNLTLQLK
ncbi:MAG TPA: hypothetical protein DDW76_14855 [Cyanobacteria bacterium UBA11369]|nr:hypothetical protein [Cyanobacteria bacterium UBA11371]HBE16310.1 hypothetical protein [Cyanobacteria bacterium UBA11367]HBE36105.1 hypothetical protein [Cyanobacteria bacterium UBA11368]HBE50037.1 hypothetical protein [Cyanobacteria bacterium UBA11369]